jgi:hypothetical protein
MSVDLKGTKWKRLLVGATGIYLLTWAFTAFFGPSPVTGRFNSDHAFGFRGHSDEKVPSTRVQQLNVERPVQRATATSRVSMALYQFAARDLSFRSRVGFRLRVRFDGRWWRKESHTLVFRLAGGHILKVLLARMRIAPHQDSLESRVVGKLQATTIQLTESSPPPRLPIGAQTRNPISPRSKVLESGSFGCALRASSGSIQFVAE